MESCLSCLGLARRSRDSENPETSRLLPSNDPYRSYNGDRPYRSHGQMQAHYLPQQDPETLRKDREAFDGICHAMSDEVVDIFTAVPAQHGFGSRVESVDQLHIANHAGKKPTREETGEDEEDKEDNAEEEEEDSDAGFTESKPAVPQEIAYKSVRKMPNGVLSRETDREENEAAGGAMG